MVARTDSYHLVEIAEKDLPPEMAERWLKDRRRRAPCGRQPLSFSMALSKMRYASAHEGEAGLRACIE